MRMKLLSALASLFGLSIYIDGIRHGAKEPRGAAD